MSRIEELIRELCPRGVEFQQLGEVARIKAGPNINKRLIADRPGPYPVINSGREPLGHVDHFNVEDDPIGIASRGSVGLVTWTKGRFFRGNLNYSCTVGDPSLLDSRFLYYYLLRSDPEIQALATHQGIPALNAGALKTLRVPIPPLELQREIVRVLDKFTQLEAELEAELEARRAQYEHYRNSLIAFSNDVERVALGDLGDLFGGLTGKSKVDFTGGNARFIAYTNVFHNIAVRTDLDDFVKVAPGERQRTLAYGDVLFTGSSESADEVGMTSVVTSKLNEPVYLNSFSIGFRAHPNPGWVRKPPVSSRLRAM
ncbi:restriction endonuclease subunit S [Kytococcus sedentarius]|uniref:restriction endonuclease subunit S n=1 Tax=Kytococcus sedentarius TaxID=1276 RepID=UPI003879FB15